MERVPQSSEVSYFRARLKLATRVTVNWRPSSGIKEKIGMKRTLTVLSAALFAGAMMVPAVQAQEAPPAGAPAAEAPAANAPAAEASLLL